MYNGILGLVERMYLREREREGGREREKLHELSTTLIMNSMIM